jgi:hypothetical protein
MTLTRVTPRADDEPAARVIGLAIASRGTHARSASAPTAPAPHGSGRSGAHPSRCSHHETIEPSSHDPSNDCWSWRR